MKRYAARVRVFWVIVVLGAPLSACEDRGITGKWHGQFADTQNAEISLTLEEDSENIFGTALYEDDQGDFMTMVEGKVEDERIELGFSELDGTPHYEAHAQGEDMMTGTWFHRGMTEKLTLKRLVSEDQ